MAQRREFRPLPCERLPASEYVDPDLGAEDRTCLRELAVLTDWRFDSAAWRIPPVVAEVSDVTHWLALTVAAAAIEDAAVELDRWDRGRIGVVLGNSLGGEVGRANGLRLRWPYVRRSIERAFAEHGRAPDGELLEHIRRQFIAPFPAASEDSLAGTMSNTITGRISNHFDLGGGAYTVDGACASSLLAVSRACEALQQGQWDLAVCGGVDVSLDPYELVGFAKARALAVDDIRPYDARAEGMLPGEGCGVLVLARLDDALRRSLRVHAQIRGWGISSDGRGAITAPSVVGQRRAIARAWTRAGCDPTSAALIEGHGTGTLVGDRVEIEALLGVLSRPRGDHRCWLGSIKGNIGHCKAAAGAAGLIKAALALERSTIPPTCGCEQPNRAFHRGRGQLLPALEPMDWEPAAGPRRAGVSAFGFGGINAHVVLEQAGAVPGRARPRRPQLEPAPLTEPALLVVSRDDEAGLAAALGELRTLLTRVSRAELYDLAHQLAREDEGRPTRAAIVADGPRQALALVDEAHERLQDGLAAGDRPDRGVHMARVLEPSTRKVEIVALFPGQGSQRPGMGRRLIRRGRAPTDQILDPLEPELRARLERIMSLDSRLFSPSVRALVELEAEDTALAQPAVVTASLIGWKLLRRFGLEPTIVLGHSLGELAALAAAGWLSTAEAIELARARGQAMADLDLADRGAMLAVAARAEDRPMLERLLAMAPGRVVLANDNAPAQLVLSGETEAVRWLGARLQERELEVTPLPVSHAFHSPLMAPARAPVQAAARALSWAPPAPGGARLVSSVCGGWLDHTTDVPALLGDQIVGPVRFIEAVEAAATLRPAMWIEVGPGSTLTGLVRAIVGPGAQGFELDPQVLSAARSLPAALARAWVLGRPIDVAAWTGTTAVRELDLAHLPRPAIVNPCEAGERRAAPTEPVESDDLPDGLDGSLRFALDWLAHRAGFPREQLRPTMRIREDLNLDSIKTIELLTALAARCGRAVSSLHQWEQLDIAELVARVARAPASDGEDARMLPEGIEDHDAEYCESLSLELVPMPTRWAPTPPPGPPSVILTGAPEPGLADALLLALGEQGLAPVWVDRAQLHDASAAAGALIWLLEPEPEAGRCREQAPAELEAARRWLGLARWCAARSVIEDAPPLRLLVLRRSVDPLALDESDAGAALLGSLALERGSMLVRWLRVPTGLPASHLAAVIRAELGAGGEHLVTAWDHDGVRHVEVTRRMRGRPAALAIAPGEPIVISGGARGISVELAACLGHQTGATLALLGRSPGTSDTVRASLDRLAHEGLSAHYWSCDVRDPVRVRSTIEAIVAAHGPIRGLLHGAGVSHPTAIDDIDEPRWWACVETKVCGLLHLWHAVDPEHLRMLHVVGSVLGHTGMALQLDYAFANAWLAGFVARVQRVHPTLHATSLGYSVWADVGLGVSLGTVEALQSMGVRALPTQAAVAAYARELRTRESTPRRVITGRLIPALERRLHPRLPPRRSRFLEQVATIVPGVELIAVSTLDHARDVHLHDHVFEGTPMLAAVFSLEAMAAAAGACIDRVDLVEVLDWELQRAIPAPDHCQTRIRVHARVVDASDARVVVRCGLRSAVDGFRDECLEARLVFGEPLHAEIEPEALGQVPDARPLEESERAALFQGPLYHWLTAVRTLEPGRQGIFDARVPGPLRLYGAGARETLTPYPTLRDALLQTILILIRSRGLPVRIARLRLHRRLPPGAELRIRSRAYRREHGDGWSVDVDAFTVDGRPVESLCGVEVAAVEGSGPRARDEASG